MNQREVLRKASSREARPRSCRWVTVRPGARRRPTPVFPGNSAHRPLSRCSQRLWRQSGRAAERAGGVSPSRAAGRLRGPAPRPAGHAAGLAISPDAGVSLWRGSHAPGCPSAGRSMSALRPADLQTPARCRRRVRGRHRKRTGRGTLPRPCCVFTKPLGEEFPVSPQPPGAAPTGVERVFPPLPGGLPQGARAPAPGARGRDASEVFAPSSPRGSGARILPVAFLNARGQLQAADSRRYK